MQIKEKAVSRCEKYATHLGMYLMALGASRATFSLQLKPDRQTIPSAIQVCGICTTKTIGGGTGVSAEDVHNHPSRGS